MVRFILLSLLWLFSIGTSSLVFAQTIDSYEASLPLLESDRELGELKVHIKEEKLLGINKDSLIKNLAPILKIEALNELNSLPGIINPSQLPFTISYDPIALTLKIELDTAVLTSQNLKVREIVKEDEKRNALRPSPFGGAINSRLEHSWGDEKLGPLRMNGQFNSFINASSFVLENQTFYQEGIDQEWYRGDTRLVKDFERQQIRTQLGDVYPTIQGFMVPKPMGGVNIQTNFSLNPYRLPFPTGEQSFTLKSRSLVKYFVNGTLVKSEYLPAGNYSASDIPLDNGLNTVLIEATDDLGQKNVFTFRSSTSINLLNKNEARFDLSYGVPFRDNPDKRTYLKRSGEVFSGYYQHGINSELSGALYLQNQESFNLAGTEVLMASSLGNFSFGHAESIDDFSHGSAQSFSFQFVNQSKTWFQSQSLGMRVEHRSNKFRASRDDFISAIKNRYALNYTLPLANLVTVALGANYGDARNNSLSDPYGVDSTINLRLMNNHSLSIFLSRNRNEFEQWNDVAYVFITITFPEKNDFISAFYDQQQKRTRISYTKDNQARLYSPRAQGTIEHNEFNHNGEMDILVPTSLGDIGGRLNGRSESSDSEAGLRGGLRVHSALVFAYQDGDWGYGLSRPVPGSFVIFKPEKQLEDQTISLSSTTPYKEAESGLFNEITFSNLLAYQYRDVQLDPGMMEEGRALVREKYTLFPTYRSAHLIKLKEKGSVSLQGNLVDEAGQPLSLSVGQLGEVMFFTNREGHFYIEGLEPGSYEIRLNDKKGSSKIFIDKDERGVINMGQIVIRNEE